MVILILLIIFVAYYVLRAVYLLFLGNRISSSAVIFESHPRNPTSKILVVGDSTGVGTGSKNPKQSVAGLLASDYPYADISNYAQNGMRSDKLLAFIKKMPIDKYDLIFIHTCGGDIVALQSPHVIAKSVGKIIFEAKKRGRKIVLLPPGDVGAAPFVPWFLKMFYTKRTEQALQLVQELASKSGIVYVDMLREVSGGKFPIKKDYYAVDGMHLSSKGNRIWHERIKDVVSRSI